MIVWLMMMRREPPPEYTSFDSIDDDTRRQAEFGERQCYSKLINVFDGVANYFAAAWVPQVRSRSVEGF